MAIVTVIINVIMNEHGRLINKSSDYMTIVTMVVIVFVITV